MLSKMIFTFWVMLLTHNVLATENVITIDQSGSNILECCVDGNCSCSNLSLALTHIQDNTEIRITSDIPLHHDVEFGNISSVIIIGYNNPTIMCDHQVGLVGNYIKQITIQNITWDKCNGIIMYGFTDTYITDCGFQCSTNFALTLNGFGSIHINGTSFSHNNGGVDALAPSIIVYNSNFNDTIKYEALYVNTTTNVNLTIIDCSFTNNSGYGVNIVGNRFTPNLLISSCNFTNNTNSSVVGDNTDITLLHNVTFYNNVVVDTSGKLSEDGAAIRVYNSTVCVNGTVMFCNNKAGNNGGAVYFLYSNITTTEGIVIFYNNSASNGGAVYVGRESNFYAATAILQFRNNTATSNGGALYVDVSTGEEEAFNTIDKYYLPLLNAPNDFVGNSANRIESNAYFNMEGTKCYKYAYFNENTFSSSVCFMNPNSQSNVTVDSSNFTCTIDEGKSKCQVEFQSSDVHIEIDFVDYFGSEISPTNYNCSMNCSSSSYYYCFIDSKGNFMIATDDTSIVKCSLDIWDTINIAFNVSDDDGHSGSYLMKVAAHWNKHLGDCSNDIAHVASPGHGCLALSCALLRYFHKVPVGLDCSVHSVYDPDAYHISPGYWYDNGFTIYVYGCPAGLCYHNFDLSYVIEHQKILPDSNSQCNHYWTGLACGECDSSIYSILYDTKHCVHLNKCDFASNFLLLLCVSLFYWCVVILFVFVLLHFQFDVTAGYAYSVIFYYSILEALANMFYTYSHSDYCWVDPFNIDGTVQALSFFSNIGNLKPPFLRYLGLCLHKTEIIDHVYLTYLHSLIVTTLITLVFVTARRYVTVARYIGRYVNSKSICLLLLLSYSSVCYTSIQLLKPLAVYYGLNDDVFFANTAFAWQTYLSPGVKYFHGRHILYGIIAILCELIIGIGLPLVILMQRYLIRYFNLKLISIKPVIDQLQGCYKEEYRWFVAYYLICRQVIYGTDIVTQFLSVNPSVTILMVCILMFAIHLWFQPYKRRSLNFFDSIILLILILVAFSGFFRSGLCTGIVMTFSILPIICLVNYLALSSKLKYILIPFSCGGMIVLLFFIIDSFFKFFLFILNSIIFLAYIIFVLKCICVKIRERKVKYVMIDEQLFDINEDRENDNSDEP
ncbi:uncharacterized protein [Dysidea avara]|uniref:uncharacterized protein n=1 Tax=Dysidea avara TaxID=196820 RepID=UPI003316A820